MKVKIHEKRPQKFAFIHDRFVVFSCQCHSKFVLQSYENAMLRYVMDEDDTMYEYVLKFAISFDGNNSFFDWYEIEIIQYSNFFR